MINHPCNFWYSCGTAAITTRGLVEDMETIVDLIDRVLVNHTDEAVIEAVANEVKHDERKS
jgi:glycine/serine hydroxymethyltransferase